MKRGEVRLGWLLILPSLALIGLVILYPISYSIFLSFFYKNSLTLRQSFAGLSNYFSLLTDPRLWSSIKLDLIFTASTVFLQLIIGMGVALLLNQAFKGRAFLQGIALFPYMLPTVVVVILWKWMLNESYGLINYFLELIGVIDEPLVWLSPDFILFSLIIVAVWKYSPFVILCILARLQLIPNVLYEAAKIDGASAWARFIYITLPELKTIIFVVLLLRTIWMFTKFDIVWLTAGGGGAIKYIETLPIFAYRQTFIFFQAGKGAAVADVMFVILVVTSMIYFKAFKPER